MQDFTTVNRERRTIETNIGQTFYTNSTFALRREDAY